MRKVLFLLALMFVALSAGAQKVMEGTAPSLKGETKINVKIDFSETKIENKSIAEWLEYRQAEQPDYSAYVTLNGSAKYTLMVYPVSISKKGKNTNMCSLLDENGTALVKFSVSGSGGTFGSMANLWGDGYGDSGKKIASFVEKCFK